MLRVPFQNPSAVDAGMQATLLINFLCGILVACFQIFLERRIYIYIYTFMYFHQFTITFFKLDLKNCKLLTNELFVRFFSRREKITEEISSVITEITVTREKQILITAISCCRAEQPIFKSRSLGNHLFPSSKGKGFH